MTLPNIQDTQVCVCVRLGKLMRGLIVCACVCVRERERGRKRERRFQI